MSQNKQHALTKICKESKTAFCGKCGLVGVRICKDGKGYPYYRCNRSQKGKTDRKKEYHRKMKGSVCELCGFIPQHSRQLDIHHIDENHFNDNPKNLQTVCYCCHRLLSIKTPEELDEIRMAGLLERRWLVMLNPNKYEFDQELEKLKNSYTSTIKKKHVLKNICTRSKTAYCEICGLVSIVVSKTAAGRKYWNCNHGGKKADPEKKWNTKYNLQVKFLNKHKKEYCEKCGFKAVNSRQLDIHHKDHNHDNNDIANLETQCANCHRLEHSDVQEKGYTKRISDLTKRREAAQKV